MSSVYFTSVLDRSYLSSLEELLFFNTNQSRISSEALSVMERYGIPRVVVNCERLRIVCGRSLNPQALYAVDTSEKSQPLIGVVIYTRENETLAVLQIAVHEDYTQKATPNRRPLLLDIVEEIRGIGRRIKGVESIAIFPGTAKEIRLPIERD